MANDTFQVVAGPSREELFDALRLRHEKRRVMFTVAMGSNKMVLQGQVNSLGIEDGSGDKWLFKLSADSTFSGQYDVEGYFNTVRRTGWVRPFTR